MNRYGLTLSLFLLTISTQFPSGKQLQQISAYQRLYDAAERLYHDDNQTELKDSIALSNYLQVIHLLKGKQVDNNILQDSYYKAGIYYQTKGSFDKAIPLLREFIKLKKSASKVDEESLYLPILYLGNSYYHINRFDSARYQYYQAEAIATKYPATEGLERLYNTLGVLDYQTANYLRSAQYFEKALAVLQSRRPGDKAFLVNYKSNLASALRKQGRYEDALEIYEGLLKYKINQNELLHNIGSIFLQTGSYAQAIKYLKRVSYNDQTKLNDLGQAYLNLHKYDSARWFLQRAFDYDDKQNNKRKNLNRGETHKLFADLLVQQVQYDSALYHYQAGLKQLVPEFNNDNINSNPKSFNGIYSVIPLFELLTAKARSFQLRFKLSGDLKDLDAAIDAYQSAFDLTGYIEKTYESDNARLALNRVKHLYHTAPIDICIQLHRLTGKRHYLDLAFMFDEKNKASALSVNLLESKLKQLTSIPPGLLEEEDNLKQLIASLSLQASEHYDTITSNKLHAEIRDLNIRLAAVQEKFEQYPDYNRLVFAYKNITIDSLQQAIPLNTAILSYHIGDTAILVFAITHAKLDYFTIPFDKAFISAISYYYNKMQATEESNQGLLTKSAKYFYSRLIKPAEANIKSVKHLVIIPDDELSVLPFEMFVNDANQILLRNFSISYNYSCTLLKEGAKATSEPLNASLTMAPFYNGNSSSKQMQHWNMLPSSAKEVQELDGTILMGKEATRQMFLGNASKYGTIHLATHAQANDKDPLQSFIVFYPGDDTSKPYKVYAPEIYNLKLGRTNLVILTACETGEGQLIKGEGVMSLSRAFSYAGCPNIITSLWKADDEATALISHNLHRYLDKGFPIAEALQRAKLEYLDSKEVDQRKKLPGSWANLRLIGVLEKSLPHSSFKPYFIGAIIIFLVAAILKFSGLRQGRNETQETL